MFHMHMPSPDQNIIKKRPIIIECLRKIVPPDKFGENVVIKKFEKSKGWLSKKLSSSNDHVDQLANILDEKSVWQRYGL